MAYCSGRSPSHGVFGGAARRQLRLGAGLWLGPWLWLGLTFGPAPAAADLVINEFLPDPVGSDAGHEFVELYNPGDSPVTLNGVTLEFANGAVAVQWLVRWTADATASVAAHGRYLIVDRNWPGPPAGQAEAPLALQNGPDAIRLVRDGTVLDLVGYGPLTDPAFFEGQAVPVSPGLSLARRPDGNDTGDNRADFVSTAPTPGAVNFLPYSLSVIDRSLDPPVLARPGDSLRVAFSLRNDGTASLPAGPCRLSWPGGEARAWWDGAVPDETRALSFLIRPDRRGTLPLTWEYFVPGPADSLRQALGAVQVGPSILRLNEILPAPGQGQGEWIELQWTGDGPGDLSGFSLADEDGAWIALPATPLRSGEIAVAAEDSSGLAGWWRTNRSAGGSACPDVPDGVRLIRLSPWPSLNNSPPASRLFADRVRLSDAQGVVVDAVSWGGPDQELPDRDLSLERLGPEPVNPGATHWTISTDPAGSTPGCPNSVQGGPLTDHDPSGLQVVPPLLNRGAGVTVVHLRFELQGQETGWEVGLFNLWGDAVRDFGGDGRGPGPRELIWDGRDDQGRSVGPGVYVAWLETRSAAGLVQRRGKSRLVVR